MSESPAYSGHFKQIDYSFEKNLPASWDAYLSELNGKQRHEIRRKIRRLNEAGTVTFRVIDTPEEAEKAYSDFLSLFAESSEDKNRFMTEKMHIFFQQLLYNMSQCGLLRLFFLDIDGVPAATALCFQHNGTMFLYNSGFTRKFTGISAGLTCKVMSIEKAIEQGCRTYDFLRGAEPYKRHLGGKPVTLFKVRLLLT
jgi:CelD/BcsL family acetyltransferase involved in cellulose biosynthesis